MSMSIKELLGYGQHWKKAANVESKLGKWEIIVPKNVTNMINQIYEEYGIGEEMTCTLEDDSVILHYVPEENYSDKDVKIFLTFEEFEDLVKFIKRIS